MSHRHICLLAWSGCGLPFSVLDVNTLPQKDSRSFSSFLCEILRYWMKGLGDTLNPLNPKPSKGGIQHRSFRKFIGGSSLLCPTYLNPTNPSQSKPATGAQLGFHYVKERFGYIIAVSKGPLPAGRYYSLKPRTDKTLKKGLGLGFHTPPRFCECKIPIHSTPPYLLYSISSIRLLSKRRG